MAYRQNERHLRSHTTHHEVHSQPPVVAALSSHPLESQSRLVFSPAPGAATTSGSSFVLPTGRSDSIVEPSRLSSDLGSLHSENDCQSPRNQGPLSGSYVEVAEDDAELDILDSHLPAFRDVPAPGSHSFPIIHSQSHNPIVPTHDGFGSFHLDHYSSGLEIQEQLFKFEQFNSRSNKRRREMFTRATPVIEPGSTLLSLDKLQWVEEWRRDQGRCFLEKVQHETRRRMLSNSALGIRQRSNQGCSGDENDDEGTQLKELEWHDQDDPIGVRRCRMSWMQTFRSVLEEIIALEEHFLSLVFGAESRLVDFDDGLPLSSGGSTNHLSRDMAGDPAVSRQDESWQEKVIASVSRELGLLVNRISEHNGAFSTYVRMQQMPIPYAGLPVVSLSQTSFDNGKAAKNDATDSLPTTLLEKMSSRSPMSSKPKQPTTKVTEVTPSQQSPGLNVPGSASTCGVTLTQKEWEQDLDVKMVFRYIRSRFTSRPYAAEAPRPLAIPASAGICQQDVASKTMRVRMNHPLISRTRPNERRNIKSLSPVATRPASSCTSRSPRRSVRRTNTSLSRHHWEIGSSVGTGSLIAAVSPFGSWGDA